MTLSTLLMLAIAIFGLLHFFLIPEIERKCAVNRSFGKVRWFGFLAGLRIVRNLSQMAILVYGPLYLLLGLNELIAGGTSVDFVKTGIALALKANTFFKVLFSKFLDGFSFVVAFMGLAYWAYRRQKQAISAQFDAVVEREFLALKAKYEGGHWEELEPTAEMAEVGKRITEAKETLKSLERVPPTEEQAQVLARLGEFLKASHEEYARLDLTRRMNLVWEPGAEERSGNRWWWPALNVFVSKGMAEEVEALGKWSSRLGTALLMLSLVGVSQGAVEGAITDHIEALSRLEVELNQAEAQKSLEKVVAEQEQAARDNPATETTAYQDRQALTTLARSFNQVYARGLVREAALRAAPATRDEAAKFEAARSEIRKAAVSEQIIAEAARDAPAGAPLAEARSADTEALWTQIAQRSDAASKAPLSLSEQHFATIAEKELRAKAPKTWAGVKQAIQAHYASPASVMDFAGTLGGNLLDLAFDSSEAVAEQLGEMLGVSGHVKDAAALANEFLIDDAKDELKEAIKKKAEIRFRDFLAAVVGGERMDVALAKVEQEHGGFAPRAQENAFRVMGARINRAMEETRRRVVDDHPPTFVAKSLADEPDSIARIRKIVAAAPERYRRDGLEALAGYENYFPGQAESESRTERDILLAELDKGQGGPYGEFPDAGMGGGGGGGPSTGPARSRSVDNVHRARSYARLRGFARVGGVLIGLPPRKDRPALDFRDIEWRAEADGRLNLILTRADGQRISLGSHRKRLIQQALAYSADERALAVTMVTANPLMELKVLAHPVLVDTPLGCRTIEIDRFVDQFTGSEIWRKEAEQRVNGEAELYLFAWREKLENGVLQTVKQRRTLSPAQKERIKLMVERIGDPNMGQAVVGLHEGADLADEKKSLLAARPTFYDPALVKEMAECAKKANATGKDDLVRIDVFGNCLSPADLAEKLVPPPPRFIIWSGVREQDYSLDPELNFLRPKDKPWPFDFILQVAFEEEGDGGQPDSQWDFQELRKPIRDAVVEKIRSDPQVESVYADLAEFALLQRLFRNALSGNLGPAFPMEKLVELTRVSAEKNSASVHTPRWNPRPGYIEARQAAVFQSILAKLKAPSAEDFWSKPASQKMQSCISLIKENKHPEAIPEDAWKGACDLMDVFREKCGSGGADKETDAVCGKFRQLAEFSAETARARQLRRALGVDREDALLRESVKTGTESRCPKI